MTSVFKLPCALSQPSVPAVSQHLTPPEAHTLLSPQPSCLSLPGEAWLPAAPSSFCLASQSSQLIGFSVLQSGETSSGSHISLQLTFFSRTSSEFHLSSYPASTLQSSLPAYGGPLLAHGPPQRSSVVGTSLTVSSLWGLLLGSPSFPKASLRGRILLLSQNSFTEALTLSSTERRRIGRNIYPWCFVWQPW